MLGRLGSFHEGLEQAGKHQLGDANQLRMALELGQNHPPGLLHGGKDPDVQRLKFISLVGCQADKGDVLLAQLDDGGPVLWIRNFFFFGSGSGFGLNFGSGFGSGSGLLDKSYKTI